MSVASRSESLQQDPCPLPRAQRRAQRLTITLPLGQNIMPNHSDGEHWYSGEISPKRLHLTREETAQGQVKLVTKERSTFEGSPRSTLSPFAKDPMLGFPRTPQSSNSYQAKSHDRRRSSLVPSYYQDNASSLDLTARTSSATEVAPLQELRPADSHDWQDFDVPTELEILPSNVPDDIRNVVQESFDEHRAIRASRQSHKHGIVVRTTITQETSSVESVARPVFAESSAMASNRSLLSADRRIPMQSTGRRPRSSVSENRSSESIPLAAESNTSLSSDDESPPPPPPAKDHFRDEGQQTFLLTKRRTRLHKRSEIPGFSSKDKGFLGRFLPTRKGKEPEQGTREFAILGECTGCFEDIDLKEVAVLPCRHSYCSNCFNHFIKTSLSSETTFPPKCCLQEVPRRILAAHLDTKAMAIYEAKSLEFAIAIGNRYYCAAPECAKWIDPRRAKTSNGELECSHCTMKMCTTCRGAGHGASQNCPRDFGLDATLREAELRGWQRCYNCRAMVELDTGCRHMICKCKAEFCYTCGAPWKTCPCTEADQARRQADLIAQREQVEVERFAEEAEIRAAIEAVEASERAMEEERRLEEERLAQEALLITTREFSRLEGITEYFEHLRDVLGKVRGQQRLAIEERHEQARTELEHRRSAISSPEVITACRVQAASDRAHLVARNETKIKALRSAHSSILVETVGRHRRDQDTFLAIARSTSAADSYESSVVLEQLMKAQDEERAAVRLQHDREIEKWNRRHQQLLQVFERQNVETVKKERAETLNEVNLEHERSEKARDADWKWFDTIFLDRILMIGEDERRMILNGGEAPAITSNGGLMDVQEVQRSGDESHK